MTFLEETVLGRADTTTSEDPAEKSEWEIICATSELQANSLCAAGSELLYSLHKLLSSHPNLADVLELAYALEDVRRLCPLCYTPLVIPYLLPVAVSLSTSSLCPLLPPYSTSFFPLPTIFPVPPPSLPIHLLPLLSSLPPPSPSVPLSSLPLPLTPSLSPSLPVPPSLLPPSLLPRPSFPLSPSLPLSSSSVSQCCINQLGILKETEKQRKTTDECINSRWHSLRDVPTHMQYTHGETIHVH